MKIEYVLERGGYNNYLLNYTLSGKGKMTYRGRERTLCAGDLTFIDCADVHRFEQVENSGWEFVFLHVSGLGVSYLYDTFTDVTGNIYEKYDGKAFLKKIIELHGFLSRQNVESDETGGMRIYMDDDGVCCAAAELVYSILTDIVVKLSGLPADLTHNLKTAIDYIHANFTGKLTLEDVAKKVFLSKYHFERMFIKYTGKTFYGYVTQLRFERARLLLDSTTKSLQDIANEIGYADVQPLNKLFKRNFGITPAEYRREKNNYR